MQEIDLVGSIIFLIEKCIKKTVEETGREL
jgi:hypothetical protein